MRSKMILMIMVSGLMVFVATVGNAAAMGTAFTFQGRLIDANSAADGEYDFTFKLYDAEVGGNKAANDVDVGDLDVTDGYFTAKLDFGGDAFDGDERWLEIMVRPGSSNDDNDFVTLNPRQQVTSAPYAVYAKNTEKYAQVVTVAVSGGDYTRIQAAIDSITDANDYKPYLVWVAPGVYHERVTMKPYVHLQGAGQEATVITSSVSSGVFPPTDGTLTLSHHTSLRDLTVVNNGTGANNTALLAKAGTTEVLVVDITAKAQGQGTTNYAIFIHGSGTSVTLRGVNALSENEGAFNYGLYNYNSAVVTLRGGVFKARGGNSAYAIYNNGSEMVAESVTALAEAESAFVKYGLYNHNGANAKLFGSSFTARGGTMTYGIYNSHNNATLEANNIHALAENGSSSNYSVYNTSSGVADVTQSVLESQNYSAYNSGGTLVISNSRLVGGPCSGTVKCVLVSRGTTISTDGSTCP